MPEKYAHYRYDIKIIKIKGDLSETLRRLGWDHRQVINVETLDEKTSHYRVFLRHKYIYK